MPSHPEGLAIARARIAAQREQLPNFLRADIVTEREELTGFLDLGRLGLTELPEELFALKHLWGLNLGSGWRGLEPWHEAASDLAPNQLAHLLAPLSRLSELMFLSVSDTDVSDLGPLSGLTALQWLDCSNTPVSDLGPLAKLIELRSLECWSTSVSDLVPLSGLTALQSLDCWCTSVSDLGPLSGLTALQSLDCWRTSVSDLGPLSGLTALQLLNCSETSVSDLGPLSGLIALQSLNCSETKVSDLPEALIWRDSLQKLYLHNTQITHLPAELLPPDGRTNCLETLRAYLRGLKEGKKRLLKPKVQGLAAQPSNAKTYCVSYAWNDESKATVDRLCDRAKEEHGVEILRDTNEVRLGDSLTRFMQRLADGDRVFVILSGNYLKSPNCMYELLEVWRNCKQNEAHFRQRIRVFRLPDAAMMTAIERLQCASYWEEEFNKLDQVVGNRRLYLLGVSDFQRYKLMKEFAHHVGDILAVIADTLQPRDFEQLMEYGFGDN